MTQNIRFPNPSTEDFSLQFLQQACSAALVSNEDVWENFPS